MLHIVHVVQVKAAQVIILIGWNTGCLLGGKYIKGKEEKKTPSGLLLEKGNQDLETLATSFLIVNTLIIVRLVFHTGQVMLP